MTEVTPIVGPVYGWRTWTVEGSESWALDATPPRLTSRGGAWTDARQEARCVSTPRDSLMRELYPEEHEPHDPVTDPGCWCGLYAYATLARLLDASPGATRPDDPWTSVTGVRSPQKVAGLVSASGRIIAAERGFRAQHMTVDTLICRHLTVRSGHEPNVAAIARSLDVDTACVDIDPEDRGLTRASFDAAFADREGVYLWMEEAPWTSDVTNEPTSASMPGTVSVTLSANGAAFHHALRETSRKVEQAMRSVPMETGSVSRSARNRIEGCTCPQCSSGESWWRRLTGGGS